MREWLELAEREFHEKITETMRRTGSVGDVIPAMITYNVPGYILKELWPAAFERWLARPVYMAFAVAEDGWGGRIDRIASRVETLQDGLRLTFSKSYVIECEEILVLARAGDLSGEEFALCRVPRTEEQDWQSRGEPGVLLETSDGRKIDHYRVSATVELDPIDVLAISKRKYTPLGIRIPRRELSSLALIAASLLEHLELRPTTGPAAELLADRAERIVAAREAGRLSGGEMRAAVEMLDVFFQKVAAAQAVVHPFWENVRRMRDRFDR